MVSYAKHKTRDARGVAFISQEYIYAAVITGASVYYTESFFVMMEKDGRAPATTEFISKLETHRRRRPQRRQGLREPASLRRAKRRVGSAKPGNNGHKAGLTFLRHL